MLSSQKEDLEIKKFIERFKFFIKDIYYLTDFSEDEIYEETLWMDDISDEDWLAYANGIAEVYGDTLADIVNNIRTFSEHKEEILNATRGEKLFEKLLKRRSRRNKRR